MTQILLDMDGPLTKFFEGTLKVFGQEHRSEIWPSGVYDMEKVLGVSLRDFWRALDAVEHFWLDLEPQPWAVKLWELCQRFEGVTVCTSPCWNPVCPTEKIQWLRKHIPGFQNQYMIGNRKSLMARSDNILIDDRDANCQKFIEAGGNAIVFPMITNSNFEYSNDPLTYVTQQLEKLC